MELLIGKPFSHRCIRCYVDRSLREVAQCPIASVRHDIFWRRRRVNDFVGRMYQGLILRRVVTAIKQ